MLASSKTETIKPDFMEDINNECHIQEERSYVTQLRFNHLTPKHNTLYLQVNKSLEEVIRLKINKTAGYFEGRMFVPKNACIVLSWLPITNASHPLTDIENVIRLNHISVDKQ